MAMERDKKEVAAPQNNLWRFAYKCGNAPMTGIVRAQTEAQGYEVAVMWCRLNDVRPPAKVFPMILADQSILAAKVEEAPELIGAVK